MTYLTITFLNDILASVHELACPYVGEEREGGASHRRDVIQLESESASTACSICVS